MKQRILSILTALTLTLLPVVPLSSTAYAACGNSSRAKGQALKGIGEAGSNCDDNGVIDVVHGLIQILSVVVGIVAVIMIIVAGFKYITAAGDANKIGGAKQTLIYALVGLAIAALAQVIVHFVLFQVHKGAD